ncbi:c-type cytochrome biogenesis protein CcmI [Methylobacterium planeticum]|uniref:C-type cytochrome biogenesis protein CcmI n=1 Tax=Methylobacterium planeticum TaxID=2615211 RepID=A0A6N6MR78_9HYPH|nr:c-type cytochrome biogenesis protein CcmI [Methylobacterium planeticum]KAB1072874.1 c-type cytochrome biogenesis protein CcmI [Methylobacterium planeticum]
MTAIWFILAFMTGAAVLALLWPMSRRAAGPVPEAAQAATEAGFYEDQLAEIERDLGRGLIAPAEAEAARTEAARRLLRASRLPAMADAAGFAEPHLRQRRAASAFALSTIPLVALLAYGLYGSPDLPAQTAADRQAAQSSNQDLMKAIGQIEAKLASEPGDARGWAVLAPVYMRLGRFDDAAHAYEAVSRLKGETPQVLSDWGEALVASGNGVVSPEAKAIFARAVALDAHAAKPRFYLARAAEQAGDPAEAIREFTALELAGPADAPWLPLVRENLARLKGEAVPATEDRTVAPDPGAAPPSDQNAAIRAMVDGLEQRLQKQGGSIDEWLRLVRSRSVLGERDKALAALDRARAALGSDGQALERLDAQATELGLATGKAAPRAQERKAQDRKPQERKPPAADQATAGDDGTARADTDAAVAAVKAMPAAERDAAVRGMVAGLDRRLSAKGGTADEWLRLVRSYSVLGERKQASRTLDRARMALAADAGAVERLDALARELDLHGTGGKP